jgi:hypothetical protein
MKPVADCAVCPQVPTDIQEIKRANNVGLDEVAWT